MHQIQRFNSRDLNIIESIPRSFKATVFVFLIIGIPFSFLFGLFGLLNGGYGYWPTTFGLLLFIVAGMGWVIVRDFFNYRKDMKKQEKIKTNVEVTWKSDKRGDWTISTKSADLKKFTFDSKETFDKINVGEKLVIEISRYGRRLLCLVKEDGNTNDGH